MFKICVASLLSLILAACSDPVTPGSTADPVDENTSRIQGEQVTGTSMPPDALRADAEAAAHQLIQSLGAQQTFAMLGWQVNPDYKPRPHCFAYWNGTALEPLQISNCETHVSDLSRLYASYGVDAPPAIFKSAYFWQQKSEFDLVWPELVDAWEAAGGSQDDASFLSHPVCSAPLQQGWTGSDFFYDGQEHPICRAHKIEALETRQEVDPVQ